MSSPEIEILTSHVSRVFRIDDVTAGDPREWIVRYRGHLLNEDTVSAYDQLADAFRPYNVTPIFRKEDDGRLVIILASTPPVPPPLVDDIPYTSLNPRL